MRDSTDSPDRRSNDSVRVPVGGLWNVSGNGNGAGDARRAAVEELSGRWRR